MFNFYCISPFRFQIRNIWNFRRLFVVCHGNLASNQSVRNDETLKVERTAIRSKSNCDHTKHFPVVHSCREGTYGNLWKFFHQIINYSINQKNRAQRSCESCYCFVIHQFSLVVYWFLFRTLNHTNGGNPLLFGGEMTEFILEIVCVVVGLVALGIACVRWL